MNAPSEQVDAEVQDLAKLLDELTAINLTPDHDADDRVLQIWGRLKHVPLARVDEPYLHCLHQILIRLFNGNRLIEALAIADQLVVCARRFGDPRRLRAALSAGAAIHNLRGSFARGVTLLAEALNVAQPLGPHDQSRVWNNIGVLNMTLGQWQVALSCFEKAASLALDPVSMVNAAQAALRLGDVAMATRHAEMALAGASHAPTDAEVQTGAVQAHLVMARALVATGNTDAAQSHLEQASLLAERHATLYYRAEIAAVAGLIQVQRGDIDAGLATLEDALALDETPGSQPESRLDCVIGYEMAGRPDAALAHLRELLNFRAGQQIAQLQWQIELIEGGSAHASELMNEKRLLESQIASKESALLEAAASAALASGYDVRRPFRVAKLVEIFAQSEGITGAALETLKLAALLQDVGMMAVPQRIVDKRGALSRAERSLLEEHTRHGAQLVAATGLQRPRAASHLIRLHHEKWDGSGPCGLKEEEIPVAARVLALCDAYDAMTHQRPYRGAMTSSEALKAIEANADGYFDPQLAQRFCAFVRREHGLHWNFKAFLGAEATSSAFVRAKEEISRFLPPFSDGAAPSAGSLGSMDAGVSSGIDGKTQRLT